MVAAVCFFSCVKVRSEIEMENLAKSYLREVLKRECWDSMKVKGKAIMVCLCVCVCVCVCVHACICVKVISFLD